MYSFVRCFPKIPLDRTKLKYGTMKLKTYEIFIWITEPGAMYFRGVKFCFYEHTKSAHWVYHRFLASCGAINEELLSNKSNPLQGTKLKYVAMQLNAFLNFFTKGWTWYDMAKGILILVWMHPRSKWIRCNLQKSSRQCLYFQSLMD